MGWFLTELKLLFLGSDLMSWFVDLIGEAGHWSFYYSLQNWRL